MSWAGLDRALLLDVLAQTSLGRLAVGERQWLADGTAQAGFAAAALTKDIDLLCTVDPLS
jgi:3-hydroxyisobutyrate dehydrogenase-like beta-hydroxyacid dehydrogenase